MEGERGLGGGFSAILMSDLGVAIVGVSFLSPLFVIELHEHRTQTLLGLLSLPLPLSNRG